MGALSQEYIAIISIDGANSDVGPNSLHDWPFKKYYLISELIVSW